MNCTKIYGVDLNKEIDAKIVRDALIDCFFEAHKEVLDKMDEFFVLKNAEELENMKKEDVRSLIQAKFDDVGGDFDNPTKEDIVKVIGELKEFAKQYRSPEIIKKHASEIMVLVDKI